MSETLFDGGLRAAAPPRRGWRDQIARRALCRAAAHLATGRLTLVDGDERRVFEGVTTSGDLDVTVHVHDPRFYRAVVWGGLVGAGESYMAGHWSASDLTGLMRLMLANLDLYARMEGGLARVAAPFRLLAHLLRRNTRAGARRNIHAHYDLGNEFFRLFLDETLSYSSAYFSAPGQSLAEASVEKMERICRKIALGPEDHVVEIGGGWGGFALHAARHHGCRVTTATISREQHDLARARVRDAGLSHRVEVVLRDYRDLEGRYDKLVSIEMIEAVGHGYLETFFAKCAGLLKPDGLMAIQAITTTDQNYPAYLRGVDFIRSHVFPGGSLVSLLALARAASRATDFRLAHQEDFGPHYAETLRRWRAAFFENLGAIRQLGYPDSFLRMWEFYLCSCEAGFEERGIGVSQLVYARPGARASVPGALPWRA